MTIPGSLPAAARALERIGRAEPTDRPSPSASPGPAALEDALRSVLTDEERDFFQRLAVLGPITYGPSPKPGLEASAPRGLRLDVLG